MCYVSRASEDSSRAKIGARAKKGKERGGGGAAREPSHLSSVFEDVTGMSLTSISLFSAKQS